MQTVKYLVIFFLLFTLINPVGELGEAGLVSNEMGLDQIEDITSAYLSIPNDEFEFGDVFTANYGFRNNESQFVANVTFELLIIDGSYDLSNFTFTETNFTRILNGTTEAKIGSVEIDTLPTNDEPLLPDQYQLFLIPTNETFSQYNRSISFEVFPVEGANIDITFSELYTNTEVTSPISLNPGETEEFEITLTNSGDGNALNLFFVIESISSPLEVESSELSNGIEIPSFNKLEQISFNFSVTAPDFGVADIQFSLTYDRQSGRTLEISPALVFHTLPQIRGVLVAPSTITSGENVQFEVLIENKENQNFTLKFFISSFTFTFQPIETQYHSFGPGLSKIIFNGITFTNGTFPASLFMTFFDSQGNDEVNIELDQTILTVVLPSTEPPEENSLLTTVLAILYLFLLISIILVLISNRIRKFVLDKLIQRTFIPDIEFSKKRVIIDGSNVAWEELDEEGKPKVENIILASETLKEYGFEEIIAVADAALRYQIQTKKNLDKEARRGTVKVLPAKVDGDSFILRLSRDTGALILTNDLYREYRDDYKWIDDRRIPYSILNGKLYLHPIYEIE